MRIAMQSLLAASALWVAGGAPAAAEGLPQLNAAMFAPQVIWLAISFTVLYLLMSRVALPKVSQVLDDRQRKIDENLRKAESLKAEAESAARAYEKALADARDEAQTVLRKAQEELMKDAGVRQAELTARLTDEIAGAEARIAAAKEAAMGDVRDMAVEVAAAAAERLLGDPLDDKTVGAAVDDVMGGSR